MGRLYIIGNSGAARECYWLYRDMCAADAGLTGRTPFQGFLSWQGHENNLKSLADLYAGEATSMPVTQETLFAIGIGEPALRKEVFTEMKRRDAKFFTLRHPVTQIHPETQLGEANIFQMGCTVFCDTIIGNANYFNGSVNIAHDVVIGDYNFFGPYTLVLGAAKLGSLNLFAVRSTLLPGCRVGNGNIIAPVSVLYKGCGHKKRMVGNPAVAIGEV